MRLQGRALEARASLLVLLLSALASVHALSTDNQQPATITADTITYNRNTGVGVYIGHVQIAQGTTHIEADRITTYTDKANKLTKAVAIGNPARYTTLPDAKQSILIATASTITYQPLAKLIVLTGHAKVKQGSNNITSPKIIYNIQTQVATTTSINQERTVITYTPESTATPPKPHA
jgi:lipopolysaccharide export system protein LptA